jgi:hypothetical protein
MRNGCWFSGFLAALSLALPVCCGQDAGDERVPLKLELPRPQFIGTPIHLKSSNLEPLRKGPRPPLMVPPGLANLALNRPVSSSDKEPIIGELSQATDGDKVGQAGSYVEIGPGPQFFQVDLGKPCTLYAIVIWHFHTQARVYHDVIVQIADDADFKRNVRTLYNNDMDNSSKLGVGKDKEYIDSHEGRLIEVKGAVARYVRCYSNGNTESELNHCAEIEVYGKVK